MHAVDDETGKFSSDPKLTFQHPYPPTKIMFIPDKENSRPDLLATTGDFLRIWQVSDDGVQLHKLLNNVRTQPALFHRFLRCQPCAQTLSLMPLLPA